ncbi:MAG TPA: carboxylating nicotinate-nucleotide diphosphorylase [Bacillota bacterium]|nr:carboxylating nicotinate-nucleotide diphosphorylase [Bacillota bacterium]HOB86065.1 carboxylating nicotinate-nucleotide diphosphorylase [Bacillota bacterium]HOP68993.1 carboxylating nicotinate-nucleotide diphosphorylase [Bacillota bacterium]HPT34052.1 carboxylating nicotinate-nucleotide diphosphorylase [Bacillota bacterium]HQD05745.1 carboxylating nicotinate-nucleotide diphosphorylase [Bacillota bacterium]
MLSSLVVKDLVARALKEDLGAGDLTTQAVVPPGKRGRGEILAREQGVIAGLPLAEAVFLELDPTLQFHPQVEEGAELAPGKVVARVEGSLASILSAERTALNFLQHLSGIATQARLWVREISDYPARLVDTRKTTPTLRLLEKYAVRVGGASNHRLGLDGGILIKENHIRAAGGIAAAVEAARRKAPFTLRIEVEVTNLQELEEALAAGADLIMLDNMDLDLMRRAVEITAGRVPLEASGNITFSRLREVAATGVDYISCGALTHSSRSLDLSLLLVQ